MKRSFIITFILALAWNLSFSQNLETRLMEDLKLDLAQAEHDTSQINIMWNIINYSQFPNPDSAIYYFEKAYALAEKTNYPIGQIRVLGSVSFAYIGLGNLPKALELCYTALKIAENYSLENETAQTLNAIVNIYYELQDYEKSMDFLQKTHTVLLNNPTAIELAYDRLWFGKILTAQGQLDSAAYYLKEAESLFQNLEYGVDPWLYLDKGNLQTKLGNPDLAMDFYLQGIELSIKKNNHNTRSLLSSKVSKLYSQKNEVESAIYFAKIALSEAELMNQKKAQLEAASILSELYEPIDTKEAFRYFKIATTAKEELFGAGNLQVMQTMITKEEQRQLEIAAAELASQNSIRLNTLIGALIFMIVLAFILIRYNRLKQKAKQNIEKAYDQLKSTQAQLIQSEKMASLGELTAGIAHEIQNPLNFVNNFSEVSEELIEEVLGERLKVKGKRDEKLEEEILGDIKENLSKIHHHGNRASSIVKGMLEHSRTGTGKKELTDINALADEYLRLSYHGLRAKNKDFNAEMVTNFDPELPKIEVIPQDIGRVLLNLINNAFQACIERSSDASTEPGRSAVKNQGEKVYKPLVSITTQQITNNQLQITITDNGSGIPDSIKDKIFQPFFTTKPTGQGTGLGLSLAYDIVKAHGGEVTLETAEGVGSKFIITLSV